MDPNATWQKLAAAFSAGRWEEAAEIAEYLTEWLSKGGFPPNITGRTGFDCIVVNAACNAIVAWEVG